MKLTMLWFRIKTSLKISIKIRLKITTKTLINKMDTNNILNKDLTKVMEISNQIIMDTIQHKFLCKIKHKIWLHNKTILNYLISMQ